ncbi:GNAT family N-acetyltransferase [Euzebya pacifica]|nr:GNAT family N-acetyltransferase [Euzebya pacifica]
MSTCRGTTTTGAACTQPSTTGDCGRHTTATVTTAAAAPTGAAVAATDPFGGTPATTGKWGEFAPSVPDRLSANDLAMDTERGTTLLWRTPDGGIYGRAEVDEPLGQGNRIDIQSLEVHPDARGRGIAKKMLADMWHRGGGRLLASTNGFTPDGHRYLSRYVYSTLHETDGIESMIHDEGIETGSGEYWDRFEELSDDREAAMRHACEQAFGPAS